MNERKNVNALWAPTLTEAGAEPEVWKTKLGSPVEGSVVASKNELNVMSGKFQVGTRHGYLPPKLQQ